MFLRSLSSKIIVSVVLVFIGAFTAFVYLHLDSDERRMLARSRRVGQVLAETVHQSVREGMLAGDTKRLSAIVESHARIEEIVGVRLFDAATGEVLAAADSVGVGETVDSRYMSLLADGPGAVGLFGAKGARALSVVAPLENEARCRPCHDGGTETLGALAVDVSVENTYRAIAESRLRMMGFGLATIVGISLVIAALVVRFVRAPIRDLVAIMDAEAPSERPAVRGADEVGYLTMAFNQMLDRLSAQAEEQRRAEAALQEAHDQLEQRVEERTQALSDTASALEAEVQEREQAELSLKAMNEELTGAVELLRDAQTHALQQERLRALGQMASGIAHDFNNALSPILGFSELLRSRPQTLQDTEKTQRYLDIMNTAARDASNIVSRMREFYRKREEGDVLRPVDLAAVIAQAISLTQPKWKDEAQARGAPMRIHADCREAPAILGDESELRECLTNLIFNACDAMPEGGDITLRCYQEQGKGGPDDIDYVRLEVSDTGIGMPPDVLRQCMDPFYTTKGAHGTGMGLAMVYGIMQRHDGILDIESQEGEGTTIRLCFPLSREEVEAAEDTSPECIQSGLRILVVDDEPLVREVTAEYLLGDGNDVETASNGVEALEMVSTGAFDLIITDRAMPEMSGDQLATAIKRQAPGARVIMLTGFGAMMDRRPDDIDAVASKPITLAELRQVVARAMRPPSPST